MSQATDESTQLQSRRTDFERSTTTSTIWWDADADRVSFLILVFLWFFVYFVEFLGNGPTGVGGTLLLASSGMRVHTYEKLWLVAAMLLIVGFALLVELRAVLAWIDVELSALESAAIELGW